MGPIQTFHVVRSMKIAAHTKPSTSGRNCLVRSRLAHTPGADESGNSRGTASFLIGVRWVEERAEEPDTNLARSRGFSLVTPLDENSSALNTLSL